MSGFQVIINEKGGQAKSLDFDKAEITIGRVQGNDIVLPKGNISKKHSRIVVKDGKFIIIDMQSTNGTYVNGKKIATPQVVKSTDKIYIGDFTLQVAPSNGSPQAAAPEGSASARPRSGPGKEEEIDLFDDKAQGPAAAEGGAKQAARGLVDENFDQEFEAGRAELDAPKPPSKAGAGKAFDKRPAPLDMDLLHATHDRGHPEVDLGLVLEAPQPEPPQQTPAQKSGVKAVPKPAPAATKGAALPAVSPSQRSRPPAPSRPAARPDGAPEEDSGRAAGIPTALAPAAMPAIVQVAGPAQPTLSLEEAVRQIHQAVVIDLGLRSRSLAELPGMRAQVEQVATKLAERMRDEGKLGPSDPVSVVAQGAAKAATDVEWISDLYADAAVHEIVVTHTGDVLAERDGQLAATGRTVTREAEVTSLIRCLAVLSGASDPDASLFDVRMRDGSRVMAVLPPIAFRGPTLSIRKTTREAFTLDALVQHGTLSEPMMRFLEQCIRYKRSILLALGPGVGASATLNALASVAAIDERVMTIECGVELHTEQANTVALAPVPGADLSTLVRYALTCQPDRVWMGVIGGEATCEILEAFAGPLEGSIACYVAPSTSEAVERLATLDLASHLDDVGVAKRLVARAFPVLVQEQRFVDGSRRITQISELRLDGDLVGLEDIFVFEPEGVDENGLIMGSFKPTGYVPRFLEELSDRGLDINMSMFQA